MDTSAAPQENKTKQFHMRVTADELLHWQQVARKLGYRTLSEMVREALNYKSKDVPSLEGVEQ